MRVIGPTGRFPRGKADPGDKGEIRVAIAADPFAGIVRMVFGVPTEWIGMPPQMARDLAKKLIEKADALERAGADMPPPEGAA